MTHAFISSDLVFGYLGYFGALTPAPVPLERPIKRVFDSHAMPPSQEGVRLSRVAAKSVRFVAVLAQID
jgi:hypothetical protein